MQKIFAQLLKSGCKVRYQEMIKIITSDFSLDAVNHEPMLEALRGMVLA